MNSSTTALVRFALLALRGGAANPLADLLATLKRANTRSKPKESHSDVGRGQEIPVSGADSPGIKFQAYEDMHILRKAGTLAGNKDDRTGSYDGATGGKLGTLNSLRAPGNTLGVDGFTSASVDPVAGFLKPLDSRVSTYLTEAANVQIKTAELIKPAGEVQPDGTATHKLWAITAERPNNSDATHVDLEYQIVGTTNPKTKGKKENLSTMTQVLGREGLWSELFQSLSRYPMPELRYTDGDGKFTAGTPHGLKDKDAIYFTLKGLEALTASSTKNTAFDKLGPWYVEKTDDLNFMLHNTSELSAEITGNQAVSISANQVLRKTDMEYYMHPARLAEAFRRLYKDSEGFRETYETGGPANTAAWWLREMDDLKLKDGKIPLKRDASGNLDTDANGLTFKPKDTNILKADNFKDLVKWIPCFGELLIQKSTSIKMNKATVKGLSDTLEKLSKDAGMTGTPDPIDDFPELQLDKKDIFDASVKNKLQALLYKKVLQTIQEGTVQRNKATLDALCNKLEKLEVQKIAEKFEGSNYLTIWIPVLQSILKPTKEWSFKEHVLGTMTTVGQHKLFVVLSCMADFLYVLLNSGFDRMLMQDHEEKMNKLIEAYERIEKEATNGIAKWKVSPAQYQFIDEVSNANDGDSIGSVAVDSTNIGKAQQLLRYITKLPPTVMLGKLKDETQSEFFKALKPVLKELKKLRKDTTDPIRAVEDKLCENRYKKLVEEIFKRLKALFNVDEEIAMIKRKLLVDLEI